MGRPSRSIYKAGEHENGVYVHVYNHCVEGAVRGFPFDDVEKEKFFRHLKRTLTLYSIECLSAVVMSNHFHLILYVPKESFSAEVMADRIRRFRKGKLKIYPDDVYCQRRLEISNDLSSFMKELQKGFTVWYNRTRNYPRRGTLWEQRFKCTKLADFQALATCLKYIELNPVRAGIVNDPAKYRFCTYGMWQQSGKHTFSAAFEKHLTAALDIYLEHESMAGLDKYFRERFAAIITDESGGSELEVNLAIKKASNNKNPLLQKSRFWIDSMVLGSQIALREHAIHFWGQQRGRKKRFGTAYDTKAVTIYSMRQLTLNA